jgi:hypothetical protein
MNPSLSEALLSSSSRSLAAFARRWGPLLVVAAFVPTACGTGSAAKATPCAPGQSIACAGIHGCAGYQVCRSGGSGYGDCLCGDGGLRSFPHVGPFSGLLGAACATRDDCLLSLDCVTRDSKLVRGEGPSAGMCLARCLVDHNFCTAVDATAKCIVFDDAGTPMTSDDLAYCLPGCKLGNQPSEADKCRGRVDLACNEDPVGAGAGYCRPACRSDIDCAPRVCDLKTGLCGDAAPSGDPIGAACDPNDSRCAGGCVPQGRSYAECGGVCSYDTEGCGQKGDPPLDYWCSIAAAKGSGPGDLGYCAKLCDCDGDCQRADAVCEPRSDLMAKAGRHGVCGSTTLPSGAARPSLPCTP